MLILFSVGIKYFVIKHRVLGKKIPLYNYFTSHHMVIMLCFSVGVLLMQF